LKCTRLPRVSLVVEYVYALTCTPYMYALYVRLICMYRSLMQGVTARIRARCGGISQLISSAGTCFVSRFSSSSYKFRSERCGGISPLISPAGTCFVFRFSSSSYKFRSERCGGISQLISSAGTCFVSRFSSSSYKFRSERCGGISQLISPAGTCFVFRPYSNETVA